MGNKYSAVRTYSTLCGREFSSKAEARRGEELRILERARAISDLQYQVKFVLYRSPKISYTADFQYIENGRVVVEDVKGVLTRDTRTKIAWVREKFGVEVRLTK